MYSLFVPTGAGCSPAGRQARGVVRLTRAATQWLGAWDQEHLEGGIAVVSAEVGDGHLYLFGPEITFRAQPHGTFKFLFNGLALSRAEEVAGR